MVGAEGYCFKMSKTQLDPTGVQQLKKLFVECETDSNIKLRYGRVRLASGERMISFGNDFAPVNIQITAIDTDASYRYTVRITNSNSFTIVSSDTTDTSEVMYLVLGG